MKTLKIMITLFFGVLFLILNGGYFVYCISSPGYYQNTKFTTNDIKRLEKLYHIDFPNDAKFTKIIEQQTGLGGDSFVSLYVNVPSEHAKPLLTGYTFLPIRYKNEISTQYGVTVSKSNEGKTELRFAKEDEKGTISSRIKNNPHWEYKGIAGTYYLRTAAFYNALFFLITVPVFYLIHKK
ncbi:hypothetical protein [Bacillus nakamurai]|uniref:hypothetical protein n=1 Tax=Bacillus nakamurai TaxID=1793963 RepID=UPI0020C4F53B|nr:hypothetical protein [Bacillus nakamurai]MCP6683167.1 hypothetical protein [Bacillus nakamurai]